MNYRLHDLRRILLWSSWWSWGRVNLNRLYHSLVFNWFRSVRFNLTSIDILSATSLWPSASLNHSFRSNSTHLFCRSLMAITGWIYLLIIFFQSINSLWNWLIHITWFCILRTPNLRLLLPFRDRPRISDLLSRLSHSRRWFLQRCKLIQLVDSIFHHVTQIALRVVFLVLREFRKDLLLLLLLLLLVQTKRLDLGWITTNFCGTGSHCGIEIFLKVGVLGLVSATGNSRFLLFSQFYRQWILSVPVSYFLLIFKILKSIPICYVLLFVDIRQSSNHSSILICLLIHLF